MKNNKMKSNKANRNSSKRKGGKGEHNQGLRRTGREAVRARDYFQYRFDACVATVRAGSSETRLLVGLRLGLMNRQFMQDFGTPRGFCEAGREVRLRYIRDVARRERNRDDEPVELAGAYRLFRMWLCALSLERRTLLDRFGGQINALIRSGRELALKRDRPVRLQL